MTNLRLRKCIFFLGGGDGDIDEKNSFNSNKSYIFLFSCVEGDQGVVAGGRRQEDQVPHQVQRRRVH